MQGGGQSRADWVNTQLQRCWPPADGGNSPSHWRWAAASGSLPEWPQLGISFSNASQYYPVAHDIDGRLTEGVFVETLQDNGDCYHRLEWLHVLESKADLRDAELALLEDYDLDPPGQFPCVQVINLAFRSATRSSLGSRKTEHPPRVG